MTSFTFEIPGEPAGKQRARAGNGRHYTPEKTVRYENLVKVYARQCMGDMPPHDGPVEINIWAYFGIPKSMPKKTRALAESEDLPCTKKPDRDNIDKIVCDAMNGIVYRDDSQVTDGMAPRKRYSPRPRVVVEVVLRD